MADGIEVADSIKINLMCGNKIWPGFINVDGVAECFGKKPDIVADARKLPFEDNFSDEIHCIHGIEHFYVWEVPNILTEWKRVMKPDSLLVIECPDIEKVLTNWANGIKGMAKTWYALYGDPQWQSETMVHRWCYCFAQLEALLNSLGFKDIVKKEPLFHMAIRDMRIECRK